MKKLLSLFLLSLSACAPYEYSARETAPDEYEIILKADGVTIDELKQYLIVRGDELCERRLFRLRGLREDTYFDPPSQRLKGDIECMSEPS